MLLNTSLCSQGLLAGYFGHMVIRGKQAASSGDSQMSIHKALFLGFIFLEKTLLTSWMGKLVPLCGSRTREEI